MGASTTIKGFVAGVEHNRRAYLFMGLSVKDDWPEFGETLEAMLRSVSFTEPEGTFTSEDLGLKLWYPEGWILEEEYDQVIFATSRDLIDSGELLTGAALMIERSSLGDARLVDWFKEELEALTFDEGGLTSDMAYRTVAGQEGLIVDLWGVPSGAASPVTGFVAAVAHEDWSYLLVGLTAVDEWSQYRPTLEEMLDSVQFPEWPPAVHLATHHQARHAHNLLLRTTCVAPRDPQPSPTTTAKFRDTSLELHPSDVAAFRL